GDRYRRGLRRRLLFASDRGRRPRGRGWGRSSPAGRPSPSGWSRSSPCWSAPRCGFADVGPLRPRQGATPAAGAAAAVDPQPHPSDCIEGSTMSTVITRDELLHAMSKGTITLIEALPAAHYAAEHLPGAINAPGE